MLNLLGTNVFFVLCDGANTQFSFLLSHFGLFADFFWRPRLSLLECIFVSRLSASRTTFDRPFIALVSTKGDYENGSEVLPGNILTLT